MRGNIFFSRLAQLRAMVVAVSMLSLTILPGLVGQAGAASCNYSQTAYGQGAYSTCAAAAPTILGLPDTGSTWIGLAGAVVFAVCGGTWAYLRRRRIRNQVLAQQTIA